MYSKKAMSGAAFKAQGGNDSDDETIAQTEQKLRDKRQARFENKRGIDKELNAKILKKFSPERAAAALQWVTDVTGQPTTGDFWKDLQDGYLLCHLVIKIDPSLKKKVKGLRPKKRSKQPFVCRQNVANFSKACQKLGMKQTDVCTSQDLYDGDNLNNVVNHIFALNALSQNVKKFKGPYLAGGVKHAKKNKRNFTAEQLAKGRGTVPLLSQPVEDDSKADYMDSQGIIKSNRKPLDNTPTQWNSGFKVDMGKDDTHDSYGIIKTAVKPIDNTPSQWNSGYKVDMGKDDTHDSYGIIKTAVKPIDNTPSQWNSGHKVDMGKDDTHDSYGIIKTAGKPLDNSVPLMNQGGVKPEEKTQFDSHGIVKIPQQKKAAGGPPPPPPM